MQPQPETMTDRLADVIQVISMGGRSGTLTVERGDDRKLEEGLITFIDGLVVDARVNQQNGLTALNYLNIWQFCRYSFIDHTNNGASAAHSPSSKTTKTLGHMNRAEHLNGTNEQSFCPLRLRAGEELLLRPGNEPLSRLQRRLLLLINGQRSVSDLARLLRRNPGEVQGFLDDLVRMGLVRQ